MGAVTVAWGRPGDLLAGGAGPGLLDDVERGRLAGLRRQGDRDRFVAGRLLLRRTVARLAGVEPGDVALVVACPRCGGPHGLPQVLLPAGPGPRVSLAHAGERVLVAVGGHSPVGGDAVGVDVEPVAASAFAGWQGFDEVAFPASERAAVEKLDAADRPAARAGLWVRRESLLKSTGEGFHRPGSVHTLVTQDPLGQNRVVLGIDVGAGYAAAVAVPPGTTVTVVRAAGG